MLHSENHEKPSMFAEHDAVAADVCWPNRNGKNVSIRWELSVQVLHALQLQAVQSQKRSLSVT